MARRPASRGVGRFGALAGLALLLALQMACGGSDLGPVLRAGDEAPSFSLPSLTGEKLSSGQLAGRPVILNFWATWCQPCRRELPVLNEMEAASAARVVAIALDEEGAGVIRPFVEEHGLTYTVLVGDQKTFQRFSGFTIPFTLVLDGSWKVVSVHRGPVEREELLADLESIGSQTPPLGPP